MGTTNPIQRTAINATTLLATLLLAFAVLAFGVWGATFASLAFLIAAFMCWSTPFETNRARGKPTISDKGRVVVATTFAALGALLMLVPITEVEQTKPSVLDASDAATVCMDAARKRIVHPSTSSFSVLGSNYRTFDNDTAIFATTFTARNSFNLELEYQLVCDFTGTALTGVKIVEA